MVTTAFTPCKQNVDVPTILVEPFEPGEEPQVWIQWSGIAAQADLGNQQFRFPVPLNPTATDWLNHPEKFRVILFGPIRNFPNEAYAEVYARQYLKNDMDARVLYLISSHAGVDDGNGGTIPIALLLQMNIELADDAVGIISPKNYYDALVQKEVIDEFFRNCNSVVM